MELPGCDDRTGVGHDEHLVVGDVARPGPKSQPHEMRVVGLTAHKHSGQKPIRAESTCFLGGWGRAGASAVNYLGVFFVKNDDL